MGLAVESAVENHSSAARASEIQNDWELADKARDMDPTQPLHKEVPSPLSLPPGACSRFHSEFWHRYFYKVHQLEQVCWPNQGGTPLTALSRGLGFVEEEGDRGYQEFWSQNQSLGKGVPRTAPQPSTPPPLSGADGGIALKAAEQNRSLKSLAGRRREGKRY